MKDLSFLYRVKFDKETLMINKFSVFSESDTMYSVQLTENDKIKIIPKVKINNVLTTNEEVWSTSKKKALKALYMYYKDKNNELKNEQEIIKNKWLKVKEKAQELSDKNYLR